MPKQFLYIALFCVLLASCSSDDDSYIPVAPVSQVTVDLLQVPYPTLSEYGFFDDTLSDLKPTTGVLPYEPISSLFSNYAKKSRFIWLPDGSIGTYNGDANNIELPVGSVIIKTFYYDNVLPDNTRVIIETRLMIRKQEGWTFAEYFWNEEQTEAFLDVQGDGGFKYLSWMQDGEQRDINYRMLQDNLPSNINTVVDYTDTSQDLETRVRSYVDINCASCHRDEGHCNYRPMRFAFSENNLLENLGLCVTPDQLLENLSPDQKLIKPGDPENSVVYYRLNVTAEEERMPLLGRSIIHNDGVALLGEWINSLDTACD